MGGLYSTKTSPFRPPKPGQETEPQPGLTVPSSLASTLTPYLPPQRTRYLIEGPLSSHQNVQTSTPSQVPHLTLTYAQSLDSSISLSPGVRTTLSGGETKAMTHFLRTMHDGILIGVGTANVDDPGLNSRFVNEQDGGGGLGLERQPRPFILDPSRRWGVDCGAKFGEGKLWDLCRKGEGRAPWWIVCGLKEDAEGDERTKVIREFGGDVIVIGESFGGVHEGLEWDVLLRKLGETGIRSLMVEGGATVINDLLRKRNHSFVSSVVVTIAPTWLGRGGVDVKPERSVVNRNEGRLEKVRWAQCGEDVVMAGYMEGKEEGDGRS